MRTALMGGVCFTFDSVNRVTNTPTGLAYLAILCGKGFSKKASGRIELLMEQTGTAGVREI